MLESKQNGAASRFAERAVGERSESAGASAAPSVPDPELIERPRRRRFSAEYKLRVLREADGCSRPGEIGALLRREGLYSSLLTEWRRQRQRGALEALERPRGRPRTDRRDADNAELRRRLERSEAELAKARKVIEVQGNVSALLGELLEPRGAQETTER
jgi:transposase-like protein